MGYFNYFIKCIIRNIAYRLCKPKVFLTVLLSVLIILLLHNTGYCADWTDGEIEACLDGLATITANQGTIISQLSSMGVNVSDIESQLNDVKTTLSNIKSDTGNISYRINTLVTKIDTINTTLIQLAEQQNIYYESVTNELEEIRKILIGETEEYPELFLKVDSSNWYFPNPNNSSTVTKIYSSNPGDGITLYAHHFKYANDNTDFQFEKGYTYNVTLQIQKSNGGSSSFYYTYDTISVDNEIKVNYLGTFTQSSLSFSFTATRDGVITFLLDKNGPFWKDYSYYTVTKVPSGSLSSIGDNLNNVNDSINQGNQLQQEQNQLQQEQNDLIKDDNVNTDNFEFATNDTNNPTEEGFNTLFTSIYNAFCNTSSVPLTITLPYVNETFTIQPNLVSNAMQKMRFGSCGNVNSIILLLWCLSFYI